MTNPTEGAVKAADNIADQMSAWINPAFITKETRAELAEILDREAVAPAVRDLMLSLDYALQILTEINALHGVKGSGLPTAERILAKYRHLTDQATDQEVA